MNASFSSDETVFGLAQSNITVVGYSIFGWYVPVRNAVGTMTYSDFDGPQVHSDEHAESLGADQE